MEDKLKIHEQKAARTFNEAVEDAMNKQMRDAREFDQKKKEVILMLHEWLKKELK